jgi:hypothetical protein
MRGNHRPSAPFRRDALSIRHALFRSSGRHFLGEPPLCRPGGSDESAVPQAGLRRMQPRPAIGRRRIWQPPSSGSALLAEDEATVRAWCVWCAHERAAPVDLGSKPAGAHEDFGGSLEVRSGQTAWMTARISSVTGRGSRPRSAFEFEKVEAGLVLRRRRTWNTAKPRSSQQTTSPSIRTDRTLRWFTASTIRGNRSDQSLPRLVSNRMATGSRRAISR